MKSVALTANELHQLRKMIYSTPMTIAKLSKKIRITYFELYNPLNKRTNCSEYVAKKIRRYLNKTASKPV